MAICDEEYKLHGNSTPYDFKTLKFADENYPGINLAIWGKELLVWNRISGKSCIKFIQWKILLSNNYLLKQVIFDSLTTDTNSQI